MKSPSVEVRRVHGRGQCRREADPRSARLGGGCEAQAMRDIEQAAQDAFKQLAEEFRAAAAEIEGLVSTFEALIRRKVLN